MNAEFHYYADLFPLPPGGHEREALLRYRLLLPIRRQRYPRLRDRRRRFRLSQPSDPELHLLGRGDPARHLPALPLHPRRPGPASRERVDGAASRWTVTPDSPLAKELLVAALKTGDDFRIGIALHTYADTWAHQHFSGRVEQGNVVDPSSPLPPAGHLQALRAPDDAAGRWTDARLVPELSRVDNAARFRAAARKIYRYLRTFLRSGLRGGGARSGRARGAPGRATRAT